MDRVGRIHLVVEGRVQGVFFRASCAREAEACGLVGWVRNVPDGRVEAVFEGPEPQLGMIVAWCRQGPPGARVDEVSVSREEPVGETGFRITG
jgi:acylphosphatase